MEISLIFPYLPIRKKSKKSYDERFMICRERSLPLGIKGDYPL